MTNIIGNNVKWVFSGIGCLVFSFIYNLIKGKTKWINIQNSFYIRTNKDISYGYIVPDNYHPITSGQFIKLTNTHKINSIERRSILENIDGKTVVWMIKINDIGKNQVKECYIIDGDIGSLLSGMQSLRFETKQDLNDIDKSLRRGSKIYVKGKLELEGTNVSFKNAEILSIKNRLI